MISMENFIVTADDVGIIKSIDDAVLELINRKVINNISVFANSNRSYEWIKRLPKDVYVSLHLTFSYGTPLSDLKKIKNLVNGNGEFNKPEKPAIGDSMHIQKSIQKYLEYLDRSVPQKELELECISQFDRFCQIFGREPDFINVHHDLDQLDKVCRAITLCFSNYQTRINAVRTGSLGASLSKFLPSNLNLVQAEQIIHKLIDEGIKIKKQQNLPIELVFHPAFYSDELCEFSSYAAARELEYKVLSKLKKL